MRRSLWLTVFAFALMAPEQAMAAQYLFLEAFGGCNPSGSVGIGWNVGYAAGDTAGTANWFGFNVYRKDVGLCGPWQLVTTTPIPRDVHSTNAYYGMTDPAPSNHAWHYQVRLADASGADISPFGFVESYDAFAACPWQTTPITEGTLVSSPVFGIAATVHPTCSGSCYPGAGLDDPLPDALVPLVDQNVVVRIFGNLDCGFEGCLMSVSGFDLAGCDALPVRPTSWGKVKSIYR